MYEYRDYFNESLFAAPYSSPKEESGDYLNLLDMVLESYLGFKGLSSNEKLFSRGLVVTESEVRSYFEMPPHFREKDIADPVLCGAARAGFDFIENRTKLTLKEIKSAGDGADADEAVKNRLKLEFLRQTFKLDQRELFAVVMALAVSIDRRYERIYGFLQDDISKGTPTTGLLFALMQRFTPRQTPGEAIPEPLDDRMYLYFFKRKEGRTPLDSPMELNPLMLGFLIGAPERETAGEAFYLYNETEIPLFFEESGAEIKAALSGGIKGSVYLENEDPDTILHILGRIAGGKLYVLELDVLAALDKQRQQECLSELFLRLILFKGSLCVKYIAPAEEKKGGGELKRRRLIENILKNYGGKCLVCFGQKEEPAELIARQVPSLRVSEPDVETRIRIWEYFLSADKGVSLGGDVVIPDLADCYEISYGIIKNTCAHAIAAVKLKGEKELNRQAVLDSLWQLNRVNFSGLATYVKPAYSWEDITIAESQRAVLKTACDRCRLRNRIGGSWGLKRRNAYGNGVSLLLYGPPGTGKTMAAQVVANELSLPMYRVDISQIFSKYIGETEKNLATIFEAATKANVILFFDEADALFSKRTEIQGSNDKYSNSETAYLLQKIEEYDGMSILATNYYQNFDAAFVRRITYAVHLESPDEEARLALWTSILPKETELEKDIDFPYLARQFELSGSNIKAILYSAAYMAGAEGMPVGPKHIVRAMQYEFRKLGLLIDTGKFGPYGIYVNQGTVL